MLHKGFQGEVITHLSQIIPLKTTLCTMCPIFLVSTTLLIWLMLPMLPSGTSVPFSVDHIVNVRPLITGHKFDSFFICQDWSLELNVIDMILSLETARENILNILFFHSKQIYGFCIDIFLRETGRG